MSKALVPDTKVTTLLSGSIRILAITRSSIEAGVPVARRESHKSLTGFILRAWPLRAFARRSPATSTRCKSSSPNCRRLSL
jgi:hypothetical protein